MVISYGIVIASGPSLSRHRSRKIKYMHYMHFFFSFPLSRSPHTLRTLILFLCIFRTHEFKLIPPILVQHHIFLYLPSHFPHFISQTVRNLVSIILNMFTYLLNLHVCNQFPDHTGHLSFSATSQEVPLLSPYLPMIENINF